MRASLCLCVSAALSALACGTSGARPTQSIDCSQDGTYKIWQNFEMEPAGQITKESAFQANDSTTGATRSENVEVIPDGPRCPGQSDSKQALELLSQGYNDWGSTFPLALASFSAYDATGTDGIALWMKAGAGERSFIFAINDRQSFDSGNVCQSEPEAGSDAVDPASLPVCPPGSSPVSCWVPLEHRCSEFQLIVTVDTTWTLYKFPFTAFTQPLNAANLHTFIDPSALYLISFEIPKAANLDLWVDDVGFYKSH